MTLIKKNLEIILFIIVLSIGIFFRLYKINTIPFGLNNDAAWEGSAAIAILLGNAQDYLPYAAEGWRGEGIVRAIVAFFVLIFGYDPITIRLSTVIFGIAFIPIIYLLIRKLFDTKLAILTSFFIAISGWHVTFSKTGWRAVTVPFFSTLAFYFLFKGFENKKYLYFILSGSFLSIVTFYTYDAARAVPIFFIFWLIIEFISRKRFIRTYSKYIAILFVSFFIVSLPMLIYAFNNWQNFTSRSEFLFVGHEIEKVGNFSPLIENIKTSALLFNVKANGNDFFIFEPLIDKPISWLLPIGFILSLYFFIFKKDKKYLFIICWLIFSLLPGILSVPNGNRAIGAVPSIYFISSVGLLYILLGISKVFKPKFIGTGFVLLFLAWSTILSFRDYLGPQRRELIGFYPETVVTTNYIKKVRDDYNIYITDNYPRELLTYYLYNGGDPFLRNYTWLENSQMFLPIQKTTTKGLAFFMFANSSNEVAANQLISKYGGKKFKIWYENDNIAKRPASLVVIVPK